MCLTYYCLKCHLCHSRIKKEIQFLVIAERQIFNIRTFISLLQHAVGEVFAHLHKYCSYESKSVLKFQCFGSGRKGLASYKHKRLNVTKTWRFLVSDDYMLIKIYICMLYLFSESKCIHWTFKTAFRINYLVIWICSAL